MSSNLRPDVRRTNPLRQDVIGHWPPDPRALFREQLGVWVVDGCASFDETCGATSSEGFVYSARHLRVHLGDRAWRIAQTPDARLTWRTQPTPKELPPEGVVFVFGLAGGLGSPIPQQTSLWDLLADGRLLLRFTLAKHATLWEGEGGSFCFQPKDVRVAPPGCALALDATTRNEGSAVFGLGILRLASDRVLPGSPVTLEIRPASAPSTCWCRLDMCAKYLRQPGDDSYGSLSEVNYWQGLLHVCHATARPKVGEYSVYFGDLHTHSALNAGGRLDGCGSGTPEEVFRFARDVGRLDFHALTEHEWQMPDGEGWTMRNDLADRFNDEGRFVTLPAFEWGRAYGQRCVYYERSHQPLASTQSGAVTPAQLWERLRAIEGRAITVAHHPSWAKVPVDWNYHDPQFDRLMEVYSTCGSCEHDDALPAAMRDAVDGCGFREVLARGYRVGCIASSDSHDGHPGFAGGTPRHPTLYHHLGSGRVAVLATELTRQAIFDALYNRRCYATTGEPIVLDFRVNGVLMGGVLSGGGVKGPPEVVVQVEAPLPVRMIEILREGRIVHSQPCDARRARARLCDAGYEGGPAWYYARVTQVDGEMAWSSPVWIAP